MCESGKGGLHIVLEDFLVFVRQILEQCLTLVNRAGIGDAAVALRETVRERAGVCIDE